MLTGLLALLVLSQLLIANEIRFQGCVARQDRALALAAEANVEPAAPECSRLPWGAKLQVEVEIRTISDVWLTRVSARDLPDAEPGAFAAHVRDAIQQGKVLEVQEATDLAAAAGRSSAWQPVIFNPNHVVCVLEPTRRGRNR